MGPHVTASMDSLCTAGAVGWPRRVENQPLKKLQPLVGVAAGSPKLGAAAVGRVCPRVAGLRCLYPTSGVSLLPASRSAVCAFYILVRRPARGTNSYRSTTKHI